MDKIFKYLITTSGLIVAVVVIGEIIDNFRVIFNLFLVVISFLLVGCVVYESFSYIYKKYKDRKNKKL